MDNLTCRGFPNADRRYETPRSETKDFYSQHSRQHKLCVCWFLSSPTGTTQVNPDWHWMDIGFASQLRLSEFKNPSLFKWTANKLALPLSQRRHSPVLYGQQTNLPSVPQEETLPSKAVCYINIFEKRAGTKAVHTPAYDVSYMKILETQGNCLPVVIALTTQWAVAVICKGSLGQKSHI